MYMLYREFNIVVAWHILENDNVIRCSEMRQTRAEAQGRFLRFNRNNTPDVFLTEALDRCLMCLIS